MKKFLFLLLLVLALWGYSKWTAPDHAAWEEARKADTLAALQGYTTRFPRGLHVKEARTRVEAVRTDMAVFDSAIRAGTPEAYQRFLRDYPGHAREAEIQAAVRAGDAGARDVLMLIEQGKVEVTARGSSIEQVHLRIRRRTPYPLVASIPAGLLFVPSDSGDQTMIAAESHPLPLTTGDWQETDVAVACTNWAKDVPSDDDGMRLRRASSPNLNAVAPLLAQTQNLGIRQAMVWIMTDNVDYHDLGKLVTGCFISFGCEGTRVIGPSEAAEAMRILMTGGIDLRRWQIWRDRSRILAQLQAGPLRDWLRTEINR